jgi:molecular chaperone GrpE (heat shock protein)
MDLTTKKKVWYNGVSMFWEVKPKRVDRKPYISSIKTQKIQKKEETENFNSEEEHTDPEEYMEKNKYNTKPNNRRNKQENKSYQNNRIRKEKAASTDQEEKRSKKDSENIKKTQKQVPDIESVLGQILERLERLEIAGERAWKAQPDHS